MIFDQQGYWILLCLAIYRIEWNVSRMPAVGVTWTLVSIGRRAFLDIEAAEAAWAHIHVLALSALATMDDEEGGHLLKCRTLC